MSAKPVTALDGVHPQMLKVASETDRKRLVGLDVEQALILLGISKQEVAGRLGYSEQSVISRWCTGLERPHFDKLFQLPGFDEAWITVRARRNPKVTVSTVITIVEPAA